MKKQKFWLLTALGSTLLAIATHGYLALQNYRLKSGSLDSKSFCNINSQFNCDAVALSKYSEVFGVPVAVWGIATNAVLILFILAILLNLTAHRERLTRIAFWLSAVVFATSIVMGAISASQLGTYCLFCITAYVLSIFQVTGLALNAQGKLPSKLLEDIGGSLREQRWIAISIIFIPILAFLGNAMAKESFGMKRTDWMVQESTHFWNAAETNNFNQTEGLVFQVGSSEPKMVIVEFADFLCSHCKMASLPLHTFAESHPEVRLIFKPYPLDGSCNAGLTQKGDGLRCRLASVVMCAESSNQKGWIAHDYLFDNQSEISSGTWTENLKEIAALTGTTVETLTACIESGETKDLILRMAEEGTKAKVPGTPTIFVNGKKLDGGQFIPVLDATLKSL